MRLFLRDSERRPDPEPVKTDDRTAILTGLCLWIATLVGILLLTGVTGELFWMCIGGLVIGVALLTYAEARSRRLHRD